MTFVGVNVEPVGAGHNLKCDFWLKALNRFEKTGGKRLEGLLVTCFKVTDEQVPSYHRDKSRAGGDIA